MTSLVEIILEILEVSSTVDFSAWWPRAGMPEGTIRTLN